MMNYEKLSDNLNLLMAKFRVNANELARRTGVPASSIKKIRANDSPNPTLATLTPLANFFAVTISQLIGDIPQKAQYQQEENIALPHTQSIPIISWQDSLIWPKVNSLSSNFVVSERAYSKHSYALIVEEDGTERFPQGTLLLIDCDYAPKNHDHVLAVKAKQNKPSIKKLLIEDDTVFLESLTVGAFTVSKSEGYIILGTVREARIYFR